MLFLGHIEEKWKYIIKNTEEINLKVKGEWEESKIKMLTRKYIKNIFKVIKTKGKEKKRKTNWFC